MVTRLRSSILRNDGQIAPVSTVSDQLGENSGELASLSAQSV